MSLLAWWKLNGDTLDHSGNEHHGVANGDLKISSDGKFGQVYEFVKGGTGVDVKNFNLKGYSEYTVCAWVKVKDFHQNYNGAIISSGNWNSNCWNFGFEQNHRSIDLMGKNYNKYLKYPIPQNEWLHVLCRAKNNKSELYVNGEYVGYLNIQSLLDSDYTNMFIGRETYAGGHFSFVGNICDVRIYDNYLSKKEIEEIVELKNIEYKLEQAFEEPTNNMATVPEFVKYKITPGWDTKLHPYAIQVKGWTTGYNGGVPQPETGHHAFWTFENGECVANFPNLNKSNGLNLGTRWLGTSSHLNKGNIKSLKTYTISWEQWVDNISQGSSVGVYHKIIGNDNPNFFGTLSPTMKNKSLKTWEKQSYTFETLDNINQSAGQYIYVYGHYYSESQGTVRVRRVQVEEKRGASEFVDGVRNTGIGDSSGLGNHAQITHSARFIDNKGFELLENEMIKSDVEITLPIMLDEAGFTFSIDCEITKTPINDDEYGMLFGGCYYSGAGLIIIKDKSGRFCITGHYRKHKVTTNNTVFYFDLNKRYRFDLVADVKNSMLKFYIDGKLHDQKEIPVGEEYYMDGEKTISINKPQYPQGNTGGLTLGCKVYEASFYRTALTEERINKKIRTSLCNSDTILTSKIEEDENIINEWEIDKLKKVYNGDQTDNMVGVVSHDGRRCLKLSPHPFHNFTHNGTCIGPSKFKKNTQYIFYLTLKGKIMHEGYERPLGFWILYENSKVFDFITHPNDKWVNIKYLSRKNDTIIGIKVYYFLSKPFYVDLDKSYIKEYKENINIDKKGVLKASNIKEDSEIKISKNSFITAKEFKER